MAKPNKSRAQQTLQEQQTVTELLAELPPEAAEILTLRYIHNYSDADIAKMMGASRGTIAMRLVRARSRLRKLMRDSSGEK